MTRWAAVCLVMAGALHAQTLSSRVNLPADSPVGLQSADFSNSTVTARGGAYVVDVRASLKLRNSTQRRIRGITLAVYSPDVTGKASISWPNLDVAPGETFVVPINNRLTRPSNGPGGPGVEVTLNGVLFDDLGFYGTDAQAQKSLTTWELEARRDREYFKGLLAKGGAKALDGEMLAAQHRQDGRRTAPGVQMVRGRATVADSEREVQLAFAEIPGAPVEVMDGTARVSDNLARAPRVTFRNRSKRPVQHVDMGWVIKDQQGHSFYAASMPADLKLGPNQSGEVREESALRFAQPVAIQSVTGYVAGVEYADGGMWIPSHEALNSGELRGVTPLSPEEQRLVNIYVRQGLDGLIEELKKF